jgi:dolichol-phosphate mannosyltransferase
MKAMILIPTYNEATSVVELLDALAKLRRTNEFHFDVTVIDDNSPDKTAEVVESLSLEWVSILKRAKKDGLGNAYRAGFAQALSNG